MDGTSETPLHDARRRAADALRPFSVRALRLPVAGFVATVLTSGGVVATMVSANMMTPLFGWRLVGIIAIFSALGLAVYSYVGLLQERADCLKDLFDADRDYDLLLAQALRDKDLALESARRRETETETLRAMLGAVQVTMAQKQLAEHNDDNT